MEDYAWVSRQVMAVLEGFCPVVKKVSIDPAYLDASGLGLLAASSRAKADEEPYETFGPTALPRF